MNGSESVRISSYMVKVGSASASDLEYSCSSFCCFFPVQLGWLASPANLQATVERLKEVKSIGMDAGLDFHGRVHVSKFVSLVSSLYHQSLTNCRLYILVFPTETHGQAAGSNA